MSSPSLLPALGLFVCGAACGAAGVLLALRQGPEPDPALVAPAPTVQRALPAAAPRGAAAVTVTFRRGNEDVRRRATLIADANVLLVSIEPFDTYETAFWRDTRGIQHTLERAVAWDFELGLVAFAVTGDAAGASLDADDGSLFVGLDVDLADSTGIRRASVATTASRTLPGYYVYGIALTGTPLPGSPLLLPGERTLAGILIRPLTDEVRLSAQAIDAGAVRDLLESGERMADVSIAGLSEQWRESRRGLEALLAAHLRDERWQDALRVADMLREQYPDFVDQRLNADALRACAELAIDQLGAGQPGAALAVLDNTLMNWTPSSEFMLLVARAQAQANQVDAAIDTLREARRTVRDAAIDDLLRDQQRTLIERVADDPSRSANEVMDLLRDAINADDHAGYHRALGLRLFEAGNYGAAVYHLQRAIELQPSLAGQLRYALEQSQQRRSTAGLIEVPLENAGNSLFVDVRLNNSAESFRFLLDTGASYSAVNTRTVLRLGLSDIFANGAVPIRLETAAGPVYAGTFRMERVDVAGAVVHDVPVVILEDLNSVDGLLGLSFLSHFGVQINPQEGKLLLTPR